MNIPKKAADPTEAALSAIREALAIRDADQIAERPRTADPRASGSAEPMARGHRPAARPGPSPDDELFVSSADRPQRGDFPVSDRPISDRSTSDRAPRGDEIGPRRPANDDRQSIGQILQALQRRPSRTTYGVASVFALAWICAGFGLAWIYMPDLQATLASGSASVPALVGIGALLLVPVLFFYIMAHMVWRSQELRLIAQSMAEVAVRLADPETAARESLVTVGQAIRREVAAMGDGVERTLARAGELESLVQNEVTALERTYNDNEVRIRALLQDLTHQRETLLAQGEQVRSAITSVHLDLTQDINNVTERLAERVSDTANRITRTLADKGEQITLALDHAGGTMISSLSERGQELLTRLSSTSEETTHAIEQAGQLLTSNLEFKTDHVHEQFSSIADNLKRDVESQLHGVIEEFERHTQTVTETLADRTEIMATRLNETGDGIADTIARRVEDISETLKATGESIVLDMGLRGGAVVGNLETSGARIADSIATSGERARQMIEDSTGDLAKHVDGRGEVLKNMLAARLLAFEEVFSHGGTELAERIARDSGNLGGLITRHLTEFDRTVKTYGGDLVDRLEHRAQAVSESMRQAIDSFDSRVQTKGDEVGNSLDARLTDFHETLETRTRTLDESLTARMLNIAETIAGGGREVVSALDQRLNDVSTAMDERAEKISGAVSTRIADLDKTLSDHSESLTGNLDSRIGQLETLLIGRTEEVTGQIETRTRAAVEALHGRFEDLNTAISTNTADAERSITTLTERVTTTITGHTADTERTLTAIAQRIAATIGGNAADAERLLVAVADRIAATIIGNAADAEQKLTAVSDRIAATIDGNTADAEQRLTTVSDRILAAIGGNTADAERTLGAVSERIAATIGGNAADAERTLGAVSERIAATIGSSAADAERSLGTISERIAAAIGGSTADAERLLGALSERVALSISGNAADVERKLTGLSEHVVTTISGQTADAEQTLTSLSDRVTRIITGNAGEVERTLIAVSTEVARNFVGKADEISKAVNERSNEITQVLDTNSGSLIGALSDKSQAFSSEIARATDAAIKEIEAKGLTFTTAMTGNVDEIARRINEASAGASNTFNRALAGLHEVTEASIEKSKQAAVITVSEMHETHSMLANDSTAMFERLREANILLQEVLSGAHDNMSSIEQTMVHRVSEFVTTMEKLNDRSGQASDQVQSSIGQFNTVTGRVLSDLSGLASQFQAHGRGLAEAVQLLDSSNRRADGLLGERKQSLDGLLATLDTRTTDLEQRLRKFSGMLDESIETATTRANDIATVVSEATSESTRAIAEQFETARAKTEEERRRTSSSLHAIYEEVSEDTQSMFRQATERFSEILHGMKHMAAEMQRELETTRGELRRGILELPQETAESTAQMRRVIVDQIEALAELNRIVARHGRGLDVVDSARRSASREDAAATERREPARAASRPEIGPRLDLSNQHGPRRPEQPAAPATSGRTNGWLSDVLNRASRDEPSTASEATYDAPRDPSRPAEERPVRHSIESLDSLSVDIARMIDHDAATELWERYKRGERNVFTRRLYTLQGQRAFDEIRRKYRGDREFKQTVDRYIGEFERLLDEVSRDDRSQVVARTYLTSETGKVYTMLAHAAGRFE